nr:MAG TPA: hypothetical protein [Caudoviricetes sp.]
MIGVFTNRLGAFYSLFPRRLIFNFDKSLKIRIFALIIVLSYAES